MSSPSKRTDARRKWEREAKRKSRAALYAAGLDSSGRPASKPVVAQPRIGGDESETVEYQPRVCRVLLG